MYVFLIVDFQMIIFIFISTQVLICEMSVPPKKFIIFNFSFPDVSIDGDNPPCKQNIYKIQCNPL
jgi:hypothetical protein